jgi:hypothetical protein
MIPHEFEGISLVNQTAISGVHRDEWQKSPVGAEFTSLSIASLTNPAYGFVALLSQLLTTSSEMR